MGDQRPLTSVEQDVLKGVKKGSTPEPGTPDHRVFQSLVQEGIVNADGSKPKKGEEGDDAA